MPLIPISIAFIVDISLLSQQAVGFHRCRSKSSDDTTVRSYSFTEWVLIPRFQCWNVLTTAQTQQRPVLQLAE